MTDTHHARIAIQGAFDLAQSIDFGFGQRDAGTDSDVMRLAFVLDGYLDRVGVAVRQPTPQHLELEIVAGPGADPAAVTGQVARVLSVDVDGRGWDALGRRDRLIGRLQAARPGLRPPLFHSAYEAAAWSVLSARRPEAQMRRVRAELSAQYGSTVEVAGVAMPVFPTPEQLLAIGDFPALPTVKLDRLHAVATAAQEGRLDTERLRALPPDEAMAQVQELPGIGPFYAQLIVIRALGATDILVAGEPRVLTFAGRLLGDGRPFEQAQLAERAEAWRPWRTWATVAIRAAGPLVLEAG